MTDVVRTNSADVLGKTGQQWILNDSLSSYLQGWEVIEKYARIIINKRSFVSSHLITSA